MQQCEVPEYGALAEAVESAARGHVVPLMRGGEPVAAVVSLEAAYTAKIYSVMEESREFFSRLRASCPTPPRDPDELQARMMHRSGRPTTEHYARLFRAEGMPADEAEKEAVRMVEADRELLARYRAS